MFKKEKVSLADKVYEDLKELIVFGTLKYGELLTVGDIAKHFNVSKTPVRDAFNRLIHYGLLEVLPYKGYIVSQPNLKDLDELFTLRKMLEGGAAEIAATTASNESIAKLEKLASVAFYPDDRESEITFMKTNFQFHVSVAETTNNRRLVEMIINNLECMQRILYLDLKVADPYSMSDEHTELVELIKRGDAKGARNKMIEHIESSRCRVFSGNNII